VALLLFETLYLLASDKCDGESECLSFDQHMQVASDMWQKHAKKSGIEVDPTVVFTTEATSMVEEQKAFVAQNETQRYPFNFNFVTNTKDVTPDSGFMKEIGKTPVRSRCHSHVRVSRYSRILFYISAVSASSADEIMLSAMSSLKAQLMPRVSIGNCCSNFHVMLNDFLSEGCGAASDNTFLCLQEYEDPALRVCCGWHKVCKSQKAAFIEKRKLNVK
jgi:hypothetical protein